MLYFNPNNHPSIVLIQLTLSSLLLIYLAQFLWERQGRWNISRCNDRAGARCSGGTRWSLRVRLRGDGTHIGVCDKRMSFTANDSRRGDQLPALQPLTHVAAICARID